MAEDPKGREQCTLAYLCSVWQVSVTCQTALVWWCSSPRCRACGSCSVSRCLLWLRPSLVWRENKHLGKWTYRFNTGLWGSWKNFTIINIIFHLSMMSYILLNMEHLFLISFSPSDLCGEWLPTVCRTCKSQTNLQTLDETKHRHTALIASKTFNLVRHWIISWVRCCFNFLLASMFPCNVKPLGFI